MNVAEVEDCICSGRRLQLAQGLSPPLCAVYN
jgi:hypothetical protein